MVAATTQRPDLAGQAVEVYRRIAAQTRLAYAVVFLTPLLLRVFLMPWLPVPLPSVHDEFSYLLAGDTFASGRLTNPPLPFWEHFETFHVLQQPTYASKFPPMQGLVLAIGQVLFGAPWIGVWLSIGLMCVAIYWGILGWIGPEWALMAGLIAGLKIGVFTYWMNSYLGGAIAAAGGALVFGALPRLARIPSLRNSLALAAGLTILLLSRPYEGGWFGLVCCMVLAWWLWKERVPFRIAAIRIAAPAGIILACTLAFVAYQNYRTTGSPFELPYVAADRPYKVASIFLWEPLRAEPAYRQQIMRAYWADWQVKEYLRARQDLIASFSEKLGSVYAFYFGYWPWLVPLLVWPYRLKTREEKLLVVMLFAFLAGMFPLYLLYPHYAAPVAACLYARFLFSIKRFADWRPAGKPIGFCIGAFSVSLMVGGFFVTGMVDVIQHGYQAPAFAIERPRIAAELLKRGGEHLILVRYKPGHSIHDEWVYNGANIDSAPVVWAREMGPAQDLPFLNYFKGRQAWLLEADVSPPRLTPYPKN